tara:strand:+ start:1901 stop:3583 length:1683 start_codon:yes stop_codon:yes gene_type:complete
MGLLTQDQLDKLKKGKGRTSAGFYAEDGKLGVNIPIPGMLGGSGNVDFNIDFSKDRAKGDIRTLAGQGIGFGLGDEIEANIRSVFSNKPKAEILKQIREDINKFEQSNPKAALTNEIIGSFLTTKYGLGKNVINTMLKMGGLGAVYGAGKSDPSENNPDISTKEAIVERGADAAVTGGISSVLGGTFKALLSPSEVALDLIKRGIQPSPFQMISENLKQMEQAIAKIPLVGSGAKSAIVDAYQSFNRGVGNEINTLIGNAINKNFKPLKKNLLGDQVFKEVKKNVNNAYDSIVGKIKIGNQKGFLQAIGRIIDNNQPLLGTPEIARLLKKNVEKYINSNFKNGFLSGNNLKETQNKLRQLARDAEKSNKVPEGVVTFWKDIDELLINNVKKFNSPELSNKLIKLDKMYPSFLAFQDAASKGQKISNIVQKSRITPTTGTVTADNLKTSGVKLGSQTGNVGNIAGGKYPLYRTSTQGQAVIGGGKEGVELAPYYVAGALPIAGGAVFQPEATSKTLVGLGGAAAMYATPQGRQILSQILKRQMGSRLSPLLAEKTKEFLGV